MPVHSVHSLNVTSRSPSSDACLATGLKRKITASPAVPRRQTARLDGAGSAPQAAAGRRVGLWLAVTQPIRRHKRSTCKPGSSTVEPEASVSRLRIPNCRERRCKTQRVLGDSRALVKFSSKPSPGLKPSPTDRITFPACRHLLTLLLRATSRHPLHCWVAVKEQHFFPP